MTGNDGGRAPNREGEPLYETPSFRRSNAFAATAEECRAVREAVGINEIHNFGKYLVTGGDQRRSWRGIVTPPLLATLAALTTGLIGSFQTFATAYMMTDGGPMRATLFYVLHLYRVAFKYLNMGYASALAWEFFVIIVGFDEEVLFGIRHPVENEFLPANVLK